jgi:hypothetical protein
MTVPPALSDLFFSYEPAGEAAPDDVPREAQEFLQLMREASGVTFAVSPAELAKDFLDRI